MRDSPENLAGLVRRTLATSTTPAELRKSIKELAVLIPRKGRPTESEFLRQVSDTAAATDAITYPVRIIPFEGQWCVACGNGHYAWPLAKAVAIAQARIIATKWGCVSIAVCDDSRHVTEVLSATAA